MLKKIVLGGAGLLLLATPLLVSADMQSDLQACTITPVTISSLTTCITGLLAKLTELQATQAPINDSAFSASPTSGNAPLNVLFTANVQIPGPFMMDGGAYKIVFGDGQEQTLHCPAEILPQGVTSMAVPSLCRPDPVSHLYANSGTYTATLVSYGFYRRASDPGSIIVGQVTITVKNGSTQPLTVTSPNGGEIWTKGTTQVIKWQGIPAPFATCTPGTYCVQGALDSAYDIQLAQYKAPCPTGAICTANMPLTFTIAKGVAGSSYNWKVGELLQMYATSCYGTCPSPAPAPDGPYTIQVCQSGTSNCDSSDNPFKVTSVAESTVNDWVVIFTNRGAEFPQDRRKFICETALPAAVQWLDREAAKYGKTKPFSSAKCIDQQVTLSGDLLHESGSVPEGTSVNADFNTDLVISLLEQDSRIKTAKFVTVMHYVDRLLPFTNITKDTKYDFEFAVGGYSYTPNITVDGYSPTLVHEFIHKLGASDKYNGLGGCLNDPETGIAYSGYDIMCMNAAFLQLMVTEPTALEIGWSNGGSITTLLPKAGDIWQKGTAQTIKWQDNNQNPNLYDIQLIQIYPVSCTGNVCSTGGSAPFTIAKGVQGSSYSWLVGNNFGIKVPNDVNKIRVCQSGTSNCDSSSGNFRIVNVLSITSISPSSGPVGTTVTINGSGFTASNDIYLNDAFIETQNNTSGLIPSPIRFVIPQSYDAANCPPGLDCKQMKVVNPGDYTIRIKNSNGASNTATFTVTGGTTAAPTVTLSVSPTSLASGQSMTVTWSSTNVTSCMFTSFGDWAQGGAPLSGSATVSQLTSKTITLTCQGTNGQSVSQSVTVTVTPPTLIGSTSAVNTDATWKQTQSQGSGWQNASYNDGSWQAAVVEGAYGVSPWLGAAQFPSDTGARWLWNYDSKSSGDTSTVYFRKTFVPSYSSAMLTITADNSYVAYVNGVQVASGDDWAKSKTVTITLTPNASNVIAIAVTNAGGPGGLIAEIRSSAGAQSSPTVSLTASPTAIASGQSSVLTLSSQNASSCSVSNTDWYSGQTRGTATVSPTRTTTYTATCTGAGGSVSQSVTVEVTSVPTPTLLTETFTSSRNWAVPPGVTIVEVLVVGGGGGGASFGGGGGGGVLYNSSYPVTPGNNITVTIGVGGDGDKDVSGTGSNGQDSVFGTLTAIGGGGGGSRTAPPYNATNGASGGSGGGGSAADTSTTGLGGAGRSGQGYTGGNGLATTWSSGGGGGAGGAGANGSESNANNQGGAGGVGFLSSISGTAIYYAGGGGGSVWSTGTAGAGGNGGGGRGSSQSQGNGVAGTANTGGGGGAGTYGAIGGAGGSGIVIVKYAGAPISSTVNLYANIANALTALQKILDGWKSSVAR